jgi:hypothetical protein
MWIELVSVVLPTAGLAQVLAQTGTKALVMELLTVPRSANRYSSLAVRFEAPSPSSRFSLVSDLGGAKMRLCEAAGQTPLTEVAGADPASGSRKAREAGRGYKRIVGGDPRCGNTRSAVPQRTLLRDADAAAQRRQPVDFSWLLQPWVVFGLKKFGSGGNTPATGCAA